MPTQFRTYNPAGGFDGDYPLVRDFLLKLAEPQFCFGRWDWMVTHDYLQAGLLPQIGLWLRDGELVAVATSDLAPDGAYLLALPGGEALYPEMLAYAARFTAEGPPKVSVPDRNRALQATAARAGYVATPAREDDAVFELSQTSTHYALPEGFSVVSMAERYDLHQYGRVLWYGFDHGGEGPFAPTEAVVAGYERSMHRPNVDLSLKIAVVAPDGNFASYCGMWYDPASDFALVEPVATDPAYRKLGLGRAAVLEGVLRCGALGAKRAFVGSSQQFYYSIGFRPCQSASWWVKR